MLGFNRMKIGQKFTFITATLITVVVITISLLIGYRVQQLAERNAITVSQGTANQYANLVKAIIEVPLDEARALAQVFTTAVTQEEVNLTRPEANLILKSYIENNHDYLAVYVIYEPNAFDGKDAEFVNQVGYDSTGRFIPYWTRGADGKGVLEPSVDYDRQDQAGDYYQIPKKHRREAIIDPYWYPVRGIDVFLTSLVVPMFNRLNQFIGIVGIDLTIDSLNDRKDIHITGFQGAYIDLYSHNGTVMANQKASYIGKNVKEISSHQQFINSILTHEPFFLKTHSLVSGEEIITYATPIQVGRTEMYNTITVNIPAQELEAEAKQILLFLVIIGALAILVTLVTMYLLSQSLIKPLLQVNKSLKQLAKGTLLADEIYYQAQDEIAELVTSSQQLRNAIQSTIGQAHAIAQGDYSKDIVLLSDQDQLGHALADMTKNLREMTTQNSHQDWLKTGQMELNEKLRGEQDILLLAKHTIDFLTTYLEASVGLFYLLYQSNDTHPQPYLQVLASYAYTPNDHVPQQFLVGQGLIGQVALEKRPLLCIHTPDESPHVIRSALSQAIPHVVLCTPFLYEDTMKGVIELGFSNTVLPIHQEFLTQVMPIVGIAVHTADARTQMQALLRTTQAQSQELQQQSEALKTQQEELQQANEELQSQAEELQTQQEELRQSNEVLEDRSRTLERQREETQKKNLELEKARQVMETKAQELELASKYKSEFLANMSHELRTPLNSLLILSQLLMANKSGNLEAKQIEYAQTIYSAGNDLLTLINDILDLSKVEAGKLEVHLVEMLLTDLTEGLAQKFRHVADEKGLAFHLKIADNLPNTLQTDVQRIKQILNNLLSNAFKFTTAGEVRLTIGRPLHPNDINGLGLDPAKTIALSVTDTGIGIPKDKLEVIFGAFQQVDGTISRRYGGTGLGLSIARQLARLLGGDIQVHSEMGQGSTFTLYLPETAKTALPDFSVAKKDAIPPKRQEMTEKPRQPQPPIPNEKIDVIEDDRHNLQSNDRILLVVEDDRKFLNILKDLAREKEFKCLIADDGKLGLQMAEEYHPHAIILDVSLPQIDGWTIMERLKDSPNTRHIPVHFISSTDQSRDAKQMGAIGHLLKPVSMAELNEAFKKIEKIIAKTLKNLLVMVSHPERQQKILNIVGGDNIQATIAVNPLDAWSHLKTKDIDCIILDVEVEPEASLKLLEQLHQEDNPVPVIIYTERELSLEEEQSLQRCADNLTVKAVRTPERLLDEVTLFLHQVEALLPKEKQKILRMVHDKEAILAGKKVLVVDDDTRNIFALMSVLENKNMEVTAAQHGKEALEVLNEHPNMDIVLMDIMMPEMDGYETMQRIRAQPRFRKLPIIALTAKAMKSDKAKCIEAGASDYLAKPVDTDKLVSLMRVWLYR